MSRNKFVSTEMLLSEEFVHSLNDNNLIYMFLTYIVLFVWFIAWNCYGYFIQYKKKIFILTLFIISICNLEMHALLKLFLRSVKDKAKIFI